jgi:hypothetical protein
VGFTRVGRVIACAVAGLVLTAGVATAAPSFTRRARVAVGFVVAQQKNNGSIPAFSPVGSTADAVVSMVAARRGKGAVKDAIGWLKERVRKDKADTIGLKAKVVLAATAAGANPRKFGGADLIEEIQSSELPSGRFGDATPVFDQALGLLALQGAGESFSTASVQWLVDGQCADGGWQFDEPAGPTDDVHCSDGTDTDFFLSDTNTTSLVVQVLGYIEDSPPQPAVDPFSFFADIRDDDRGGWGYSWGFEVTDANSTALVLQAYAAQGLDAPNRARRALARLQYGFCSKNAGAFAFSWSDDDGDGKFTRSGPDVGASIGAVMGLTNTPFWFGTRQVTKPAPKPDCK